MNIQQYLLCICLIGMGSASAVSNRYQGMSAQQAAAKIRNKKRVAAALSMKVKKVNQVSSLLNGSAAMTVDQKRTKEQVIRKMKNLRVEIPAPAVSESGVSPWAPGGAMFDMQ